MKLLRNIFIGLIFVLVILFLARNIIAKSVVEGSVKAVTGMPLSIGQLNLGITQGVIDIKDIKLFNPAGFEDKLMVDVPEIYVKYDMNSLLKGAVHLYDIKLDLKEFMMIKNAKGETNIDKLKALAQKKEEKGEKKEGSKGKMPQPQIDALGLKVGKVIFKDYSKGGEPSVQEFNINLDERYENITNLNSIASLIVVKILTKTGLSAFTNIDLNGLQSTLKGSLKDVGGSATKILDDLGGTTKDTLKKTTESLKGLIPSMK